MPSPGHDAAVREMRRVLERHVVGRDDDVAHQREVGVAHRGAVHRGYDRHLDIEQRVHEALRVPEHVVDAFRRQLRAMEELRIGIEPRAAELGSGASEYDDAVLAIRTDFRERPREFGLGLQPPAQRTAIRVHGHLQYAVAPLQLEKPVALRVLVEPCHPFLPRSRRAFRETADVIGNGGPAQLRVRHIVDHRAGHACRASGSRWAGIPDDGGRRGSKFAKISRWPPFVALGPATHHLYLSLITAVMLRREDFRLVAGEGRYTADWSLPGELHAVFLRSDRAHAEILRLDAAKALALPGVRAVLTGEDTRAAGFKSLPNVVGYPGRNGQPMVKPHLPGARHEPRPFRRRTGRDDRRGHPGARRRGPRAGRGRLPRSRRGDLLRGRRASGRAAAPRQRSGQSRFRLRLGRRAGGRRRVRAREARQPADHGQPAPRRQRDGAARLPGVVRRRQRPLHDLRAAAGRGRDGRPDRARERRGQEQYRHGDAGRRRQLRRARAGLPGILRGDARGAQAGKTGEVGRQRAPRCSRAISTGARYR